MITNKNHVDALHEALITVMHGEALPTWSSPQCNALMDALRAVNTDPAAGQILGGLTLAALSGHLRASMGAECALMAIRRGEVPGGLQ